MYMYVCIYMQVRGKDNVGATMDSMELERQRGITIQVSHSRRGYPDLETPIFLTQVYGVSLSEPHSIFSR